jgi:uncharacterized membrane protein
MAFHRSLRLHTLRAEEVLPFYDGVFAVAFTLLAYNLPDRLMKMMAGAGLMVSVSIYALAGIAVFIYWFKLRRLILIDRLLQPGQLALVALALMTVVLLPKLVSLVLQHGAGSGNLFHWSVAQVVNTLCLSFLVLFNGICLLYAESLRKLRRRKHPEFQALISIIATQKIGLVFNLGLIALELGFSWFDTQYIYLFPLVLLAEELFTAARTSRCDGW